ncbi:hypothetical protein [Stutzerimonas azotifigens]|uniref:DUF4148 domain-containing protein n=1 Tax=Stutzerimonas azotifigens TaxID=291995 RepID=A0ABR5Z0N3_9GAMM|nr:hypothetical protein [Stutzerimonas azotifigens]MBA1273741.1 hypothetical protein [Stutzerimonas azotifigens]
MNHFAAIASFVTASAFASVVSAESHQKAADGLAQAPGAVAAQLDSRPTDDSRQAK